MISLAQCIFINVLSIQIPRQTSITNPKAVLDAGADSWREIVPEIDVLGIQSSYMTAVRSVLILALAAAGVAFIVSLAVSDYSFTTWYMKSPLTF